MRLGALRHIVENTITSVRRAGLQHTASIVASTVRDARFDRQYGTDTAGYEDPLTYGAGDPRAARSNFYVPTRAEPFLACLRRAALATTGTFVDYGCGKGRAMLLAAQYGFRSLTGIDFSPVLCDAAQRNIARFRPHVPDADFEVICGDAGDYVVRPDDSVFYFYDPFHDDVIVHCLHRIAVSLDQHPRTATIIYHNNMPLRPTPFDASDQWAETPLPRFDGNAFYLFTSRSSGRVATVSSAHPTR
jgi:SAM-dependent methyltransferase